MNGQQQADRNKGNGIVIFGGTGDLAYRKLFPALYNLHVLGELPADYRIVGIGRRSVISPKAFHIIRWILRVPENIALCLAILPRLD